MSSIPENFRAFLLADAGKPQSLGQRIHEDYVPQADKQAVKDFVWFRRRQTQTVGTLDSSTGEAERFVWFDFECVSQVPGNAKALAEWIRGLCDNYRGAFGDSTVQGIFVNDQDGDYARRNSGDDTPLYVESLDVQVCT